MRSDEASEQGGPMRMTSPQLCLCFNTSGFAYVRDIDIDRDETIGTVS